MASSINASTAGSGGVITTADNSGVLNIQTAGTTAVTVDASQNVGIGATSNGSKLYVHTTTNKNLALNYSTYYSSNIIYSADDAGSDLPFALAGTPITFNTQATERMRIDSSGNLLVGTTTSLASGQTITGGNGPQFSLNTTTRYTQFNFYNSGTQKSFIAWDNTNTNLYVQNSSGGVYLTNTGTSWTSNSDERLKENLVNITDGLSKVCSLRSVIGNFIADKTKKKTPFLIAQDVQTVLPEAVTTSTLKDDESNTEYLGIAYTEVIPLLVASIKELNAKVDAQALEIKALKGAA
jgi:hypothetical protein